MADREVALARSRQRRSLSALQEQFTDRYFPGGDAFPQAIIRVHDAAHQWSNISPTNRGEAQQQLLDLEGTAELARRTGARGFVNSAPLGIVDTEEFLSGLDEGQEASVDQLNRLLRGANRGAALTLDEANSPGRMQSPEISPAEHAELRKRGREFYGGVADDWLKQNSGQFAKPGGFSVDVDEASEAFEFTPNGQVVVELPANSSAASIHRSGDRLKVEGGYDVPGAMPYGPKEQLMNPPLQLGVDARDYKTLAAREVQQRIDRAKASSNPEIGYGDARRMLDNLGMRPLRDYVEDENVTSRMLEGRDRFSYDDTSKAMDAYMKEVAPQWVRSSSPGDYTVAGDGLHLSMPRTPEATDVGAAARQLDKIRRAAGLGARAAGEITGAVPLFDPEFRQAVERGDVRKAGEQIAKEYLGGTAAAAVMGLGAGAASRLAPQATAAVLPAVVGATRIANPVAVVSQLGGSTKPSQRQQSIERQQDPAAFGAQGPSANPQLLKAEAARRRGGRWKIGPFTVPELGLSEAGGFLFR